MKPAKFPVWISFGLALLGLLLTAYLTIQSLGSGGVAGCGGGSGCDQVLTSRWAGVGPVPVGVLGFAAYLAVLFGLGVRTRSVGLSVFIDRLLWFIPPVLIVAAIWFTGVQLVDVKAICPFCMASHAIGLVLACFLVFGVMRNANANPKPPIMLGFVAGGAMITLQLVIPPSDRPVATVVNPFVDRDGDAVLEDGNRYVGVFGGELQFVLDDMPYHGEPDAEQVVVVLFDYACPHCRTLHQLLHKAKTAEPGRFVMVPLPISIDERDNPHASSENPRFDDSYELALLSLAVHEISPPQWQAFDLWLFGLDEDGDGLPRTAAAARAKAEQLVGKDALQAMLNSPSLEQIHEKVDRYIALMSLIPEGSRYIPLTTTPGAPSHLTERFDDPAVLFEMLDDARAGLENQDATDSVE